MIQHFELVIKFMWINLERIVSNGLWSVVCVGKRNIVCFAYELSCNRSSLMCTSGIIIAPGDSNNTRLTAKPTIQTFLIDILYVHPFIVCKLCCSMVISLCFPFTPMCLSMMVLWLRWICFMYAMNHHEAEAIDCRWNSTASDNSSWNLAHGCYHINKGNYYLLGENIIIGEFSW